MGDACGFGRKRRSPAFAAPRDAAKGRSTVRGGLQP
jgi:hypothetical protein